MVDYVFKPYKNEFPQLFLREKKRIQEFLTPEAKIEHFGSTAVPGLGGKGIIDIYVITPSELIESTKKKLIDAGYEFRPQAGTEERFVFIREIFQAPGEKERYHIHLTHPDSYDFKKDLTFRDYLRTHPDEANKYAHVKILAAKEANQSKEKYMDIKRPVITHILEKALQDSEREEQDLHSL